MHDVEQYHMPYFGNVTIVDSSDDPKLHGDFYAKVENKKGEQWGIHH